MSFLQLRSPFRKTLPPFLEVIASDTITTTENVIISNLTLPDLTFSVSDTITTTDTPNITQALQVRSPYQITYNTFATNALPSGWTAFGTGPTYSGGAVVLSASAGDPNHLFYTNEVGPDNREVYAEITFTTIPTGDGRLGIAIHGDSASTGRAINLVYHGSGQLRFLEDGVAWGTSTSLMVNVGETWAFKIRYLNGVYSAKAWNMTGSEPTAWTMTWTLTHNVAYDKVGITNNSVNEVGAATVDNFLATGLPNEITTTENTAFQLLSFITKSDTVTVTENTQLALPITISVSDSITVSESKSVTFSAVSTLSIAVSDSITVSEVFYTGSFVTTSSAQFRLDGNRFRFIGVNKYPFIVETMSQADVVAYFAACQSAGIKVVRTWCFDAGYLPSDSAGNFRYLYYPLAPTNIITNPSFETDTSGYVLDSDFTRSSSDAEDGTYSIHQVSTSLYQGMHYTAAVSASTDYVWTFWYKLTYTPDGDPSHLPPTVRIEDQANADWIDNGLLGNTTTWKRHQVAFNSGSNTQVRLSIYNYGGNNDAFYDNWHLGLQQTPALTTREATFTQLDMVLDEARKAGVRLVLSLADNPTYRTKETYISWANSIYSAGLSTAYPYSGFFDSSYCRTIYKDFVDILLARVNTINARTYKNDDTIFSWELGNELRYDDFSGGGDPVASITSWIQDVGGHIQSNDEHHLVGFGSLGHQSTYTQGDTISNGPGYGIDYNTHSALAEIDYLDFHTYPTQDGGNSENYPSGETDILSYGNRLSGLAAPIKQTGSSVSSKAITLNSAAQIGDQFVIHAVLNIDSTTSMAGRAHTSTTDDVGNAYTLSTSVLSGGHNEFLTLTITGTNTIASATTITVNWSGGATNVTAYIDENSGRINSNSGRSRAGYETQLQDFVTIGKANGKPIFMTEVGFSREVIRSNAHFPLYPRFRAFIDIFDTFFKAGGDGIALWTGEISDAGSYSINFTGTWDGTTTNSNWDDRPLARLITQENNSTTFTADLPIDATTDSITVSESRNIALAHQVHASDTVTVTENIQTFLTIAVVVSDTITTTESVKAFLGITLSVSDTITTTEAVQESLVVQVNVSDTITTSEAVNTTLVHTFSVSDTITITESVKRELNSFITLSDSITTTESTNLALVHQISVSDTITTTESIKVELNSFIAVSDSITTTESVQEFLTINLTVSDSITVSELVKAELNSDIRKTESISISEAISLDTPLTLAVSDSISVSENTVISLGISINKNDTITVTELAAVATTTNTLTLAVSDSTTITEAVSGSVFYLNIIDSYSESNATAADVIDGGAGDWDSAGQSFTANGTTLDSAQLYLSKLGSPTGTAVIKIYAHTGTFGTSSKPTGAVLATSSTIDVSTLPTELFPTLKTFNFSGADRITLTDATKYVLTIEYTGGDASNGVEPWVDDTSPSHPGNYSLHLVGGAWSAFAGSDMIFYVYGEGFATHAVNVSDSITVSENVGFELNSFSTISDAITVSESVKVELTSFVSVSDTVTTSENIARQLVSFVSTSDTITTTESVATSIISISIVDSYSETNKDSADHIANGLSAQGDAQSFTGTGQVLDSVKWYLSKFGNPTGNISVNIYTHTGVFGTSSAPGTLLATANNLDISTLSTSFALQAFTFSGANRITLANGTKYVASVEYNGGDASNYLIAGIDGSTPAHPGNASQLFSGVWTGYSFFDMIFYVYGEGFATPSVTASDSITVSESVQVELNSFVALSDTITTTDTPNVVLVGASIAVSDAVTVSESLHTELESSIIVSDTITVSENVLTLTTDPQITVSDSITVSEATKNVLESQVQVSDTISLSEANSLVIPLSVTASDTITVSEAVATNVFFPITVSDTITVTESNVTRVSDPQIVTSDTITTTDVANIAFVRIFQTSDSVSVSEAVFINPPHIPDPSARLALVDGRLAYLLVEGRIPIYTFI